MSVDEQHRASLRAAGHRASAEQLAAWAFTDESSIKPTDIQMASGLAAIVHLLLAIEDRLNYGRESILDGTASCKTCRAMVLSEAMPAHQRWHQDWGTQ